jgi:hypothetical protein
MSTATDLAQLESQLNSFDHTRRDAALQELTAEHSQDLPATRAWVNLHCHSFYSYNGYGLSPAGIVWMAKKLGLAMVGLVDFDVLDGVDEFHAAGRLLGVRTIAGMETRAYVPSFASREINSPGEPGITYHMGAGFISSQIDDPQAHAIAQDLAARSRSRNLALLAKVNEFLTPISLDYEQDVLPLTPAGNATERHICQAYQQKAERCFPETEARAAFWQEQLGCDVSDILNDPAKLQGLIRSKTMKRGGVGYQQPDQDTFPELSVINDFSKRLNGIPMQTWLDGTSQGEQDIEELMDLMAADGVCALNIVPDRNWNIADAATKARKVQELHAIVERCDARGWPICVGTELNAPGLKFVDDFDAPELAPVVDSFRRGAHILYGHSVALALDQPGYRQHPGSITEKNDHFENLCKQHQSLPERK